MSPYFESIADPTAIRPVSFIDARGSLHLHPNSASVQGERRFEFLRQHVIAREFQFAPMALLAACLVLYDGISDLADLEGALKNACHAYQLDGHVCIEWLDADKRQNRRLLSPISASALAGISSQEVNAARGIHRLDQYLRTIPSASGCQYSLEHFLADAQAWLAANIPGALCAHSMKVRPLCALPRHALARRNSGLAIRPEHEPQENETHITQSASASAISAYYDAQDGGGSESALAELIHAVGRRGNAGHGTASERTSMLRRIEAIPAKFPLANACVYLVIAWTADAIESGGRTGKELALSTVTKYVGDAARLIFQEFKKRQIERMDAADWQSATQNILSYANSASVKRTMESAIRSWHHFLFFGLFDIEPVGIRCLPQKAHPIPAANMVWDPEIDRMREWISRENVLEARLREHCLIALCLLSAIRIRTSELFNLRLIDLRIDGDAMEVDIVARLADGGGKSAAARRTQVITDAAALKMLRPFVESRQKLSQFISGIAPSQHYLFCDPYHPDRRFKIGAMYTALLQTVKAVTGDAAANIHTFSHRKISLDIHTAFDSDSTSDVNIFDQLASNHGHANSAVGFEHYYHFPEFSLRSEIDKLPFPPLSDALCATWAMTAPECFQTVLLKQKKIGGRAPRPQDCLVALAQCLQSLPWDQVTDGISLWPAVAPVYKSKATALSLFALMDILVSIESLDSPENVALLAGMEIDTINCICTVALRVLSDLRECPLAYVLKPAEEAPYLVHKALANPPSNSKDRGRNIHFKLVGQPKLIAFLHFVAEHFDSESVRSGTLSWLLSYRKGFVSLDNPINAAGLIKLLNVAGVPRSRISVHGVYVDSPQAKKTLLPLSAAEALRHMSDLRTIFLSVDPVSPNFRHISLRRGIPNTRLMLLSKAPSIVEGNEGSNAVRSMAGFQAVMFAAALLIELRKDARFNPTLEPKTPPTGES